MRKEFLSYRQVRNNAIILAHRIHLSGFVPDVIYVLLRGGAYLGNVISEYFKLVKRDERPIYYAAVVARSYVNIHVQEQIKVDGWTYDPEYLRQGDRILFIDDIFDTGRTINHLVDIVLHYGIPRNDIKIAVHDYKIREYVDTALPVQPDFYCRKHLISSVDYDFWIHYSSHELVGLTEEERIEHYYNEDENLKESLEFLYSSHYEKM